MRYPFGWRSFESNFWSLRIKIIHCIECGSIFFIPKLPKLASNEHWPNQTERTVHSIFLIHIFFESIIHFRILYFCLLIIFLTILHMMKSYKKILLSPPPSPNLRRRFKKQPTLIESIWTRRIICMYIWTWSLRNIC